MKAEELMIGDWVYCNYPSIKKNVRVDQIRRGGDDELKIVIVDVLPLVFTPEDIDPIPLTPEILEKNGFEKRFNYQWKYRDNSCKIVISIAPQIEIEGEILGESPINLMLEGALFNIDITSDCCYVHTLQHALRLCGIEKEIVL